MSKNVRLVYGLSVQSRRRMVAFYFNNRVLFGEEKNEARVYFSRTVGRNKSPGSYHTLN